MSEAALKWAADQSAPDPLSKFLLFRLASYADPQGCVWVFVGLMAKEMGVSERTVQNRLKVLFGARLIEETGRSHRTRTNRIVPIRRLPLERSEDQTFDTQDDRPATGEPSCTPTDASEALATGEASCTRVTQPCTPMGEAVFTPIMKEPEKDESSNELSPTSPESVDCFNEFWRVYPNKIQERAARAIFGKIVKTGIATPTQLIDGAKRFANAVRGRDLQFVTHPTTWLQRDGWVEDRVGSSQSSSSSEGLSWPSFAGPPEIRAAAVAARGEAWTTSWLDPCAWDAEARALVPALGTAFDRIGRELGRHLKALGIGLVDPTAAKQ